jgi:hypothetical protein
MQFTTQQVISSINILGITASSSCYVLLVFEVIPVGHVTCAYLCSASEQKAVGVKFAETVAKWPVVCSEVEGEVSSVCLRNHKI